MKKITISIILILASFIQLKAQDGIVIQIKSAIIEYQTVDVNSDLLVDYSSGHSPLVLETDKIGVMDIFLNVENNTTLDKQWRIKRIIENGTNSDWLTSFTFETSCFMFTNTSPYCTPVNSTTNLHTPSGDNDDFTFHIIMPSYGTGKYKLFLGDCDTDEDSIEIYINSSLESGVEIKSKLLDFSMYPNPANNQVSIQLADNKKGHIQIVDLIGNSIYKEEINGTSIVNTSEFKNGFYFVEIEINDIKSETQKLIVKH
jgi:hypothetical protein